ncbi:DUF1127 domain-containing protein [Pseudomonas fuscovaginae UPB0736]|uniref:Uncharacterized conserved protein YjiS, DUF1127 family n=1 Tax=Pseudomonas asplenii TaxID=53407 RepID=A0A1H6LBU2_9PSED|nr:MULTISPECIES: DUF1127 domain-containing protein [Pseudomonas]UUQ67724.1 DUF1127 domain-containing protein [Pseudomonas fuscovaginae UPB0736]UZE29015.1 DUF1127 domain-containing protein [Pseudomonas asplenii]SEH85995.1 Uncharacterized conserved protein YjiS, DUF1127 family [Pseudomonas fuscovaginae]
MNGLSDVRLVLRGQELMAEQERAGVISRVAPRPPAMSRMKWFWHRLCTRKALRELTPDELRDIGLSRTEALAEAHKPFWR